MPIITDPEGIDPIDPDNPPSAGGQGAEDHRCEMCAPTRDRSQAELDEHGWSLKAQTLPGVADLLESTLCVGKDPALPEEFGPGGERRDAFLTDRRIVACSPCQPVADLVTAYRVRARELRASAQQAALEGDRYDSSGVHSVVQDAVADELELVLATCVRLRCPGTALDQAAEAILEAVDKPLPAPPGELSGDAPHEPVPPAGTDVSATGTSPLAGPDDIGFHHGGGEVELIEPEQNADDPVSADDISRAATTGTMAPLAWIVLGAAVLLVILALSGWWFLLRGSGGEEAGPATTLQQAAIRDDPITAVEDAADDVESEAVAASEFAESNAMTAVGAVAATFGVDRGDAQACILDGLTDRNTTQAEYEAMANPDISTWPPGLAEAKAEILEECIDLEKYYLAWFGSFEFQDEACVGIMTDHVLANWSWLRFLEMGILDPVLRPLLDAEFAAFVSAGYGEKGCFAATG